MLPRILSVVGGVLIAIFALDLFFIRGHKQTQSAARPWEVAPIMGFLGTILLGLAFAEAARREVVDAWRWGLVVGFLLSACIGAAMWYRMSRSVARNESGSRKWLRIAQTYGLILLLAVLSIIIAVRIVGAMLEVFIASALGTLIIAIALCVFTLQWRHRSVNREE